ncbi:MAG: hypothetical protein ACLQPD_28145 [Desulfomonilaceae bacterium]
MRFKIVNATNDPNAGRVFDDENSQSWSFVAEDSNGRIAVNGILGHKIGVIDKEGTFTPGDTMFPNRIQGNKRPGIKEGDTVEIVDPGTTFPDNWIATESEWIRQE